MKKDYFKYAAVAVIGSALLSVLFSVIYFVADTHIASATPALDMFAYIKQTFDILALFIGYGTIIFTFARFGVTSGLYSIALFFGSFGISVLWQIIGTCIYEGDASAEFILFTTYYSFGSGFITQMFPAMLAAFITYKFTAKGTKNPEKFISMKNPSQKAMIVITLIIFGLNIISRLAFNIMPFLITENFFISVDEFAAIIFSICETIIFYLILEYVIYMAVYKIYTVYLNNYNKLK